MCQRNNNQCRVMTVIIKISVEINHDHGNQARHDVRDTVYVCCKCSEGITKNSKILARSRQVESNDYYNCSDRHHVSRQILFSVCAWSSFKTPCKIADQIKYQNCDNNNIKPITSRHVLFDSKRLNLTKCIVDNNVD